MNEVVPDGYEQTLPATGDGGQDVAINVGQTVTGHRFCQS